MNTDNNLDLDKLSNTELSMKISCGVSSVIFTVNFSFNLISNDHVFY